MAKKILIIGDTIVDRSVNLSAIGLSLESPTIKTTFIDEEINFGGAANVAKYAFQFGLDVTFVTCMSSASEIQFAKLNRIRVINLHNSIENIKTRFYVGHGDEKYKYLQINNTHSQSLNLEPSINMNEYDVVAFSDYRCGLISQKMIDQSIISSAKTFGASQVSSHKSNFERYMKMDYIVCNDHESKSFSRRNNVVITKGAAGCELNGSAYPTRLIKNPKNIIGAGDCFYAAYLAYENIKRANECAYKHICGEHG
jgi:bifunctional ADP-heptose synthase (sugar kinase/adenylyltransferase)